MGRHPYRCSDGEPLFVDYKDNGLQIDLRRSSSAVPMTLTAPAQGLQYVGETATATFKGSQLTVVEGEGRTRICEREGTRCTVLSSDTSHWNGRETMSDTSISNVMAIRAEVIARSRALREAQPKNGRAHV